MFNKNNFCHIASNNRNEKKAGVFVYKTTDDLATVLTSGYFNDKIVDINLHDLIIHEWHNPADRTKVQRNILCVIERTLDNVGTTVIKSKWEGDIEQAIADLQTYVDSTFVKKDGTSIMTGPLLMRATQDFKCAIAPYWDGIGFFKLNDNNSVTLMASLEYEDGLTPATDNKYNLGTSTKRWKDARIARVITATLNNGYDIAVPVTNSADTLALKSEVDLAANSGRMITAQGVWYAKMYAATVAPAADDDTNYADFSQTDGQGNPIIVIYERQSGAWVQSETITPPAEYDGYVPITSKIWDIPEQAGQQGGRILWNHQSKEFTPYPQIISLKDAALTGNSTVVMPAIPTGSNIPNKKYVDDLVAAVLSTIDTPELFDWKWKDCTTSRSTWALSDGNWITTKADAYQQLLNEYNSASVIKWHNGQQGDVYTQGATPSIGDNVYSDTTLSILVGTITSVAANFNSFVVDNKDAYVYDGNTSEQTETIASTTIKYIVAPNGRKIVTDLEETNADTIYTATGVAWYYILDIANQQFKLPRTKFGFTGLRDTVGNYVAPGLPNITGNITLSSTQLTGDGAFSTWQSGGAQGWDGWNNYGNRGFNFDASRSSAIYGNSTTVQPPATQMYLYFYVGA